VSERTPAGSATAADEPATNPLVQSILDGTAPSQLKIAAARGALPLPRVELFLLLVVLARDTDAQVSEPALQTLGGWPAAEVATLVADPATPSEILAFLLTWSGLDDGLLAPLFANPSTPVDALSLATRSYPIERLDTLLLNQTRLIESPELLDEIDANPAATPLQRERVREFKHHFLSVRPAAPTAEEAPPPPTPEPAPEPPPAPPPEAAPEGPERVPAGAEPPAETKEGVYQRILRLNINEKITLAARGSKEERGILIRDSNRSVQDAVIGSPKITEQEIETIAKMRNVKDEILRRISTRRDWMKRYAIVHGLATNPKTPIGISMVLLKRLNIQDLKNLISDRNLPDALRRMAKKSLDARLNTSGRR
jgi:hypothetical protein